MDANQAATKDSDQTKVMPEAWVVAANKQLLERHKDAVQADRSIDSVILNAGKAMPLEVVGVASREEADLRIEESDGALVRADLILSYVDASGEVKVSGTRAVLDEYNESHPNHGFTESLSVGEVDGAKADLEADSGSLLGSLQPPAEQVDANPVYNDDNMPPIYEGDPGFDEGSVPPDLDDMTDEEAAARSLPSEASIGPEDKGEKADQKSDQNTGQNTGQNQNQNTGQNQNQNTGQNQNQNTGQNQNQNTDLYADQDTEQNTDQTFVPAPAPRGPGILATYFSAEAAAGRAARAATKAATKAANNHAAAIKVKSENYKSSVKALDKSVSSMEDLVGDLSKTARSVALGALANEGVTGEALNKLVKDGALAPDPIHEGIKKKIIEAISGHRDLVEDFVSKADDAGVDSEKSRGFIKGHSDSVSAVVDAATDHTHDESFADRIRRTAARIQAVIDRVMSAIHRMGPTDADSAALDTENSTAANDDASPVSEPEPVAVSDDDFSPSN